MSVAIFAGIMAAVIAAGAITDRRREKSDVSDHWGR